MLKNLLRHFVRNRLVIFIILAGTLTWSLTMVRSGINGQFWGANAHDGIWHIALAKSIARGTLEMPTFAGEQIRNYHIGFDLLLAFFNKITGIPVINLYFQVIPPLLALSIGLTAYLFVSHWRNSKAEALWVVFFVYFGGSLAWIFGKQDSMFWAQQSVTTLINPPFALSLLVIFTGLIGLYRYTKSPSVIGGVVTIMLFGMLSQIKIYAFILVVGGLFLSSVWDYYKKRNLSLLIIFFGTALLGTLIFVPINSFSSGVLVFYPFWFLETMMLFPDRVGWVNYFNAMQAYSARGEWIKTIVAYFGAFIIFISGNFGSRLIGKISIFRLINKWKKITSIDVFIYAVIAGGIIFPMLFVQTGTAWNTIQFFYYSLFFMGILAGIALAGIKSKVLAAVIVLLTIPTTINELKNIYLTPQPSVEISSSELEALDFLETEPLGVVLTYPTEHSKSTAYVSAYTNKPVYLEDEINLNIMGYEWEGRRTLVENITPNLFSDNNIEYIYQLKSQPGLWSNIKELRLTTIYENNEVLIYEVN